MVHVEDVALGHVLVAERGTRGERYLLGSENLTWADIHQTIAELCGVRGPTLTTTLTAAYLAASAMELAARWTKKSARLHPGRGQGARSLLLVPQRPRRGPRLPAPIEPASPGPGHRAGSSRARTSRRSDADPPAPQPEVTGTGSTWVASHRGGQA